MVCPSCGTENRPEDATCAHCGASLLNAPVGMCLTWQSDDGSMHTVALHRSITVGRVTGNDIVIPDSALSRQHARFEVSPNGAWLTDLGSLNGVFLNDERIADPRELHVGDVVRIGRTTMTISLAAGPTAAFQAVAPGPELSGELTAMLAESGIDSKTMLAVAPESPSEDRTVLAAPGSPPAVPEPPRPAGYLIAGDLRTPLYDSLSVGRAEGNDIRISDDRVMSRNHGRVERRPDGIWVVDNASANGTFVNDARIGEPVLIADGDEVRFGNTVFRFEAEPVGVSPATHDSAATALALEDLQDQTLQGSEADLYIREAELEELQALRSGDTEAAAKTGSPPLDKYHVLVNFGPEAGRYFILEKDVTVVGRASEDADYDIQLNDRAVSRPHAKIVRGGDGFTIQDLESANGTWLNYTEELTAPHRLVDGDIIKIGKTTLVFRVPAAARPIQPEAVLDPTTGQILTAFSLKGGVGTTTVAVNLALLLRTLTNQSVLLVDLATERGAVTVHLNLAPRLTLADLPNDPTLIDLDSIHAVIAHHPTGIDVLPAPPSPQTAELVTPQAIAAVLPIVRSAYKWIIVDTSPSFSELNLGVLDLSDLILLTFAPDVTSLKIIQSTLDVLAALQTPAEKRVLVLNETHSRARLKEEDVQATLGERIGLHLPYAGDPVLDSIDRGVPLAESNRGNSFVQAIEQFAAKLSQVKVEAAAAAQPRRGGFGQWVQGVLGSIRR